MKRLLYLAFIHLFFCVTVLNATTISPFKNLGEMAKHTSVVVVAKAIENYEEEINGTTRYRTRMLVETSIKGILKKDQEFSIQNMKLKIGDLERIIFGDLELEEGKTYLLFLEAKEDTYIAKMLSYGTFKEVEQNGQFLLIPLGMGHNVKINENIDGERVESLGVYHKKQLIKELSMVTDNKIEWNAERVLSSLHLSELNQYKSPPSHCSYLLSSQTTTTRWRNAENTAIPVYYHAGLDPGCSNTVAQLNAAASNINSGYPGVSISNAGTHNFVPMCTDGTHGNEFITYVNANMGQRSILIQYNDPCNEIADLSGCSGTLAVGGLYGFSSTHNYLGETYNNAAYGYVIVNNGTGACQCPGNSYEIMLTHELSHSLNIGHIPFSSGNANMNPSCCNAISALDQECVNFIYPLASTPIELGDFSGKNNDGKVLLSWNSLSELNNNYYSIEKLQHDGHYKEIGRVQGMGTTSEKHFYEFIDVSAHNGDNLYRLSQTDYDGHRHVLKIISVKVSHASDILVFPNPLNGRDLNIVLSVEKQALYTIEVVDVLGKVIYHHRTTLNPGRHTHTLSALDESSSLLFVKITNGEHTEIIKVAR